MAHLVLLRFATSKVEKPTLEILLQRRSRKVTEPNTYGFLGGGLEPEELHFLKTQGCAQLRKKALLRAALREAAEEGGAGSPTMEPVVLPALVVAKEEVVPSKPIKYQSKSQTKNAHLPSSLLQLLSQSELPPMVTFKGAGVSKNGVKAYTNTFVFHLMEGPEAEWKPRALPEHRVEIDERSPYLGYRWVRLIHSGPAFGAGKLCAWVRALFNQHREEFWSAVQLTKHGLSPTSKLEATVRPASAGARPRKAQWTDMCLDHGIEHDELACSCRCHQNSGFAYVPATCHALPTAGYMSQLIPSSDTHHPCVYFDDQPHHVTVSVYDPLPPWTTTNCTHHLYRSSSLTFPSASSSLGRGYSHAYFPALAPAFAELPPLLGRSRSCALIERHVI